MSDSKMYFYECMPVSLVAVWVLTFFFMIFGTSTAKKLKEKLEKGFVQTCSANLQIFELRWSSHFPQAFPHRAVEPGPSFSCYLLIYFFWSAVGAQTVRLQERSNWNEKRQCPLCWDSLSPPAPGIREAMEQVPSLGLLT